MKGRVACEISTCECLIAAEAIFKGAFAELTPAEAVALLAALVNQHKLKSEEEPRPGAAPLGEVPEALKSAVRALEELTVELGELQLELGALEMPSSSYLGISVRPSLTAVRPPGCNATWQHSLLGGRCDLGARLVSDEVTGSATAVCVRRWCTTGQAASRSRRYASATCRTA